MNTPAYQNTDKEIWRKRPGDFYSPSIFVTEKGDIGINVGGFVIVSPVETWHKPTFGTVAGTMKGALNEETPAPFTVAEGGRGSSEAYIGDDPPAPPEIQAAFFENPRTPRTDAAYSAAIDMVIPANADLDAADFTGPAMRDFSRILEKELALAQAELRHAMRRLTARDALVTTDPRARVSIGILSRRLYRKTRPVARDAEVAEARVLLGVANESMERVRELNRELNAQLITCEMELKRVRADGKELAGPNQ